MNKLELIGLSKLSSHIYKALERLQEEEEGRQEHLRIFTKAELEHALEVLKALEDNNEN